MKDFTQVAQSLPFPQPVILAKPRGSETRARCLRQASQNRGPFNPDHLLNALPLFAVLFRRAELLAQISQ